MATYSTIDALNTLCTSIPEWNNRLNELNGQIALRQIELARLTDDRPPTAHSLRNKGSTESLRPKDREDNPFLSNDPDQTPGIQLNPFEPPKPNQDAFSPARRPSSSAAGRAAAVTTPPPPKANSNPRPSPSALNRQSSQPTQPAQARIAPAVLRKRKTESLASGESFAPKYRTRSMIIVYYDSAVQLAFEELVKFVSGSRNAMRKGKMAAKMAEMRRAAEMEVEGDDDDDDSQQGDLITRSEGMLAAQKKLKTGNEGLPRPPGPLAADLDPEPDNAAIPKLRFVSTRQMGPSRDYIRPDAGSTLSIGMLRGYKRGMDNAPDIFDGLDKALEWCQSQCETAAHQFLREGDCSTEIENIKKKLGEVKDRAETEMERLKKIEAEALENGPTRDTMSEKGKGRELKSIQVRKDFGMMKDLEVDDSVGMEVDDDEGVDDLEPPKLVFKRSRDVGR